MKIRFLSSLASVMVFLLSATLVSAASVTFCNGTGAPIGQVAGTINIGREFTVTHTITVNDLSVFDYGGNGLVNSHAVTLFQIPNLGATSGTVKATVMIPSGTSATLENSYRYKAITSPITLNPGTYSVIAYGLDSTTDASGAPTRDPYGESNGLNPSIDYGVVAGNAPYQFVTAASPAYPNGNILNYGFNVASFHYTPTAYNPPLKIMPLGDSITWGGANAGYRGPLYNLMSAAGMNTLYVGSITDNPGNLPASQQHHEGHGGFTIQGGGRDSIMNHIDTWLGPNGSDPDVILMMIGTNDIDTYAKTVDQVPQATANLGALITKILNKSTGLKPNAKLVLAQITPIGLVSPGQYTGEELAAQAYNTSIVTLVAQHQALGEKVSLVDMHSALNSASDFSDFLHPSTQGYEKMAQVWYKGITAAVPEPSSIVLTIYGLMGLGVFVRLKYKNSKIPN